MMSSVTLSPDYPNLLVKNDQYYIIFQMRCISYLFVDIDF